jgi:hypothetical protein
MTNLNLIIRPKNVPMTWNKFIKTTPSGSIALDGFVKDKPRFDLNTLHVNFDHHHNVGRIETRSTSGQVLLAIRKGLFDLLWKEIDVLDCDEDVCLAVFLLINNHLALSSTNPLLNKLVFMEDILDTTGGSFSIVKSAPILKIMNWIFGPYREFRSNGKIFNKDENEYREIIDRVEQNILAYLVGNHKEKDLDLRYEVIETVGHVVFVNEIGINARVGMLSDGIKSFVSIKKLDDNRLKVIISKYSDYQKFDIKKFYKKANELEGCKKDSWGGSDSIGGSPYCGTVLKQPDLKQIALECQ